ncbi:unnamed protein product, partial [Plutella xylostella]
VNFPLLNQEHGGLGRGEEGEQVQRGHGAAQPRHRVEVQHVSRDVHQQVAQVLGQDEERAERAADAV